MAMGDLGVLVVYSGAFLIYSFMEVLGLMPQEVKSAGLALPAIFSKFYGDVVGIACNSRFQVIIIINYH